MKKIALFLFVLLSTQLFAQKCEENFSYDWNFNVGYVLPINYTPIINVKQISYSIEEKGKTKKYVKDFNNKGKISKYSKINKDGKLIPISIVSFNSNNYTDTVRFYDKKGELKGITTYIRAENGTLLEHRSTDTKSKIHAQNTWKYNKDGCMAESIRYKKGGVKVKNKWSYEYHDKCDKSKSVLYNGKGKIIKTWSYNCKKKGEILEEKKDETQVCKWEEGTGDYLINVNQTFDEKGNIVKTVSKHTRKDTLIVEITLYNGDDELYYKATYNKDFRKPLLRIGYYKGKIFSEHKYEYKNGLKTSNSYYKKGKIKRKTEYKHDEGGLLTKLIEYKSEDEVKKLVKLSYIKHEK